MGVWWGCVGAVGGVWRQGPVFVTDTSSVTRTVRQVNEWWGVVEVW